MRAPKLQVGPGRCGVNGACRMPERLHSHQIGGETEAPLLDYSLGAIAHVVVWGGLQLGALSPLLTFLLWRFLGFKAAASFLALAIFTVLCPFSHSKHFCRFYLKAARTVNGATAWVPDDIMRLLQGKGYLIPGFTSSFSDPCGIFFLCGSCFFLEFVIH